MTDQANFVVNYAYDSVGRLAGLKDAGGANIVAYTYNNAGQLTRKDNGNQTYSTYEYDAAGQLLHLINYSPDNSVSSRFDYSYDVLGRIKTMSTLDGQWTYTYDATGQLTRAVFGSLNPAAVPNQDLQYAYDPAGNRTSAIVNGVVTTYSINNLNQYTSAGTTAYYLRCRRQSDQRQRVRRDRHLLLRHAQPADRRLIPGGQLVLSIRRDGSADRRDAQWHHDAKSDRSGRPGHAGGRIRQQ